MSRLVTIEGGGAKPFRVLGPGADPDDPDFADIIFDADNATFLVIQEGQFSNVPSAFWEGYAGTVSPPAPLVRSVAGKRPIFLCAAPPVPSDPFSTLPYGGFSGYRDLPFRGFLFGPFGGSGNPRGGCGLVVDASGIYPLNWAQTTAISSGGVTTFIPRPISVNYIVLSNVI